MFQADGAGWPERDKQGWRPDRPFRLPWSQTRLVKRSLASTERTVMSTSR
ncbi:hypothetical protein [Gluconobacter cerinus]|nr:hypothetical protein [Gluconobacter cerinus]